MIDSPEQQPTSKWWGARRAGAVTLPALGSAAAGLGTYLYGWRQPAEVIGAVSAAGAVAAAMVALWIAVSDVQRRERAELAQKTRDREVEGQRAAVVVVRTSIHGPAGDLAGSIGAEVMNLGEQAVLDATIQAVWCLEPPTWDEQYGLIISENPEPRFSARVLRPDDSVNTHVSDARVGPLRATYAGGHPPATGPSPRDLFGKVVTVARWQERSGMRWERVEDHLPRRVDLDGPTPLPDGARVLWDRDSPLTAERIITSVRPNR